MHTKKNPWYKYYYVVLLCCNWIIIYPSLKITFKEYFELWKDEKKTLFKIGN